MLCLIVDAQMKQSRTLLLTRCNVRDLLSLEECIVAVETAFKQYAESGSPISALMHVDSVDGEFHVKAGTFQLRQRYFVLKSNGGFFQNVNRFSIPNIIGIIILCDGHTGYPLAIMDS